MLKRVVHPGEILRDELAEFGVSPASFAHCSENHLMAQLPNLEAVDVKTLDFMSVLHIFFISFAIVDCSYSLRSYPNGCHRGRAGP